MCTHKNLPNSNLPLALSAISLSKGDEAPVDWSTVRKEQIGNMIYCMSSKNPASLIFWHPFVQMDKIASNFSKGFPQIQNLICNCSTFLARCPIACAVQSFKTGKLTDFFQGCH